MSRQWTAIATLAVSLISIPAIANEAPSAIANSDPQPTLQTQAASSQVIEACIRGEAATLPIPFTDLSPDYWAFEAIMTMHYCGVYRPPVPAETIRQLLSRPNVES
jgi:hypothetical protein